MDKIKKINNLDELDVVNDGELFDWDGNFVNQNGTSLNFIEQQEIADKEIEVRKELRVNFRWNKQEIERCKKIAAFKGLPYQTYIKSVLKMVMDKDQIELDIS